MKFDGRKSEQYYSNRNGLNDVYVWKMSKQNYSVGINGTSHHYGFLTAREAKEKVTELINVKN